MGCRPGVLLFRIRNDWNAWNTSIPIVHLGISTEIHLFQSVDGNAWRANALSCESIRSELFTASCSHNYRVDNIVFAERCLLSTSSFVRLSSSILLRKNRSLKKHRYRYPISVINDWITWSQTNACCILIEIKYTTKCHEWNKTQFKIDWENWKFVPVCTRHASLQLFNRKLFAPSKIFNHYRPKTRPVQAKREQLLQIRHRGRIFVRNLHQFFAWKLIKVRLPQTMHKLFAQVLHRSIWDNHDFSCVHCTIRNGFRLHSKVMRKFCGLYCNKWNWYVRLSFETRKR